MVPGPSEPLSLTANQLLQACRLGIRQSGIVDNGCAFDHGRDLLPGQEADKEAVKDYLPCIVDEIENGFGPFDGSGKGWNIPFKWGIEGVLDGFQEVFFLESRMEAYPHVDNVSGNGQSNGRLQRRGGILDFFLQAGQEREGQVIGLFLGLPVGITAAFPAQEAVNPLGHDRRRRTKIDAAHFLHGKSADPFLKNRIVRGQAHRLNGLADQTGETIQIGFHSWIRFVFE